MHPRSGPDRLAAQEGQVRRLRQRIFKAAQEQDWPKVRNLQKLTAPRGALLYPGSAGRNSKEIPGPDALPGTERGREPQHGRKLMAVSRRKERRIRGRAARPKLDCLNHNLQKVQLHARRKDA